MVLHVLDLFQDAMLELGEKGIPLVAYSPLAQGRAAESPIVAESVASTMLALRR